MIRILGVLLAIVVASQCDATAQEAKVGAWMIEKAPNNVCWGRMRQSNKIVIFESPSPTGQNHGALLIADEDREDTPDGEAAVTIGGKGPLAGVHAARTMWEYNAYRISFDKEGFLNSFPDRWRLTAHDGSELLIDIELTDFKRMVSAVVACAGRTPGR